MSTRAQSWAAARMGADLTPAERWAWHVICGHLTDDQRTAKVSRRALAQEFGTSEKSVYVIVNRLVDKGYLAVSRERRRAATYAVPGWTHPAVVQSISGTWGPETSGTWGPETDSDHSTFRAPSQELGDLRNDASPIEGVTLRNAGGLAAPPHPLADADASMSVNSPTMKDTENVTMSDTNDNNGVLEEKVDESVVQAQFSEMDGNRKDNGDPTPHEVTVTSAPGVPDFETCMASWDAVA